MRNIKGKLGVLVFGLIGVINTSHAALNDLGNGLVNDTTLNITWMKDANLFKTSCDANNDLWQAFDPSPLPAVEQSSNTKAQMCTNNGVLNWFEAEAWIAVLNAQSYLGHNDWRQPSTMQADTSCESQFAAAPHCFQNTAPFDNAHSFAYWSGSELVPLPSGAWYFNTFFGFQGSTLRIASVCLSGLCVVDNPSLRLFSHRMYRVYQYRV